MDLTALGDLSVKDGFAKYGAKAVFDLSGKLLHIHVCAWNKDVYPPKEGEDGLKEWNYAKWVSMATFLHCNKLKCCICHTCDLAMNS